MQFDSGHTSPQDSDADSELSNDDDSQLRYTLPTTGRPLTTFQLIAPLSRQTPPSLSGQLSSQFQAQIILSPPLEFPPTVVPAASSSRSHSRHGTSESNSSSRLPPSPSPGCSRHGLSHRSQGAPISTAYAKRIRRGEFMDFAKLLAAVGPASAARRSRYALVNAHAWLQYDMLKIAPATWLSADATRTKRSCFSCGPTSHLTVPPGATPGTRHSHPNAVQCRPLRHEQPWPWHIGRLWNRFRRGNRCPYRLHAPSPGQLPQAVCLPIITREPFTPFTPPCSSTPLFAVTIPLSLPLFSHAPCSVCILFYISPCVG